MSYVYVCLIYKKYVIIIVIIVKLLFRRTHANEERLSILKTTKFILFKRLLPTLSATFCLLYFNLNRKYTHIQKYNHPKHSCVKKQKKKVFYNQFVFLSQTIIPTRQ